MRTSALPMLLALLTACPPPPLDSGEGDGPTGDIRLLFPETDPEVTYCPDLTAYVSVSDFTLSEDIGGEYVAGEGHWHLLRQVADCEEAVIAETADNYAELTGGAVLPEGTHRLIVELVDNQHQPMTPPVRFEANIRVEATEDCVGG